MMGGFHKLPGFKPVPAGQERVVLRALPRVLLLGSLLLGLPSLLARLLGADGEPEAALRIMTVDIYAIGLLVLHWTIVFTVAIAAFIVLVMKGPAYVADPYPLEEDDPPG
jgi:hypothetical protein